MKYVYQGDYREFRGYVFTKDKPVDITDRGTLELIKREPDFKEIQDEEKKEASPTTPPVLKKFNRSEWMKKMHAEGRMRK